MKALALVLVICIGNYCYSQNLVPNPGFEQITDCSALVSGISNLTAPPWNGPDFGSADLFNTCSLNDDRWLVPVNGRGYQYPHSGNGYAGAVMYYAPEQWREYLQVKLDSDLVANQTYDVSFYVSKSRGDYAACNNIGLYFSKTAIHTDSIVYLHLLPQIVEKAVINDTANWTAIGGKFIARGGERYIIIGNFFDNNNTSKIINSPFAADFSYYYIDDVTVKRGSFVCSADFTIQGNPSLHSIKITGPSCKSSLMIYNVLGQLLYETNFINAATIDIAFLPVGIYFIECQNGNQKITKRFLKG